MRPSVCLMRAPPGRLVRRRDVHDGGYAGRAQIGEAPLTAAECSISVRGVTQRLAGAVMATLPIQTQAVKTVETPSQWENIGIRAKSDREILLSAY
jgi:hypothetical protein